MDIPGKQPPPVAAPPTDPEARQMAMLAHLLGALVGFLGPLIIWLMKKDEGGFAEDQAKEALNFHLTLIIIYIVAVAGTVITCGLLFFLPFVPVVMQIVFGVIGSVQASNGVWYRYPVNLRFLK